MDQRLREAERVAAAEGSLEAAVRHRAGLARAGEIDGSGACPAWWEECEFLERVNRSGHEPQLHVVHRETGDHLFVRLYLADDRVSHREARLRRAYAFRRQIRHPDIPAVHSVQTELSQSGIRQFVMREEFVPGKDAWSLDADVGNLPWREACRAAEQIAWQLVAVREAGFVHTHVCPENVRIDPVGRARLLGWWNMRPLRPAPTKHALADWGLGCYGGAYYLPPEAFDPSVTPFFGTAGEVYSLCATLYKFVSTLPPFFKSGIQRFRQIRFDPAPDPREGNPEVPDDLTKLIHAGMRKRPMNRPTLEHLAAGLAAVRGGRPLPDLTPGSAWPPH